MIIVLCIYHISSSSVNQSQRSRACIQEFMTALKNTHFFSTRDHRHDISPAAGHYIKYWKKESTNTKKINEEARDQRAMQSLSLDRSKRPPLSKKRAHGYLWTHPCYLRTHYRDGHLLPMKINLGSGQLSWEQLSRYDSSDTFASKVQKFYFWINKKMQTIMLFSRDIRSTMKQVISSFQIESHANSTAIKFEIGVKSLPVIIVTDFAHQRRTTQPIRKTTKIGLENIPMNLQVRINEGGRMPLV